MGGLTNGLTNGLTSGLTGGLTDGLTSGLTNGLTSGLTGSFGCRVMMEGATHLSTFTVGTITHQPPELMRSGRLSKPADVFSFGVLSELWSRQQLLFFSGDLSLTASKVLSELLREFKGLSASVRLLREFKGLSASVRLLVVCHMLLIKLLLLSAGVSCLFWMLWWQCGRWLLGISRGRGG
jgi:hypothetical protein